MKRSHLLLVSEPPEALRPLFEAADELGLRLGWLDWQSAAPLGAGGVPADLSTATGLGALRAVTVGADGSIAVKRRRGPAVLEDVLRESFRGCALVLVRVPESGSPESGSPESGPPESASRESASQESGLPELARLSRREGSWWVSSAGGAERPFTTEDLARSLRRPRPFS